VWQVHRHTDEAERFMRYPTCGGRIDMSDPRPIWPWNPRDVTGAAQPMTLGNLREQPFGFAAKFSLSAAGAAAQWGKSYAF
jgi:hypothetical protein